MGQRFDAIISETRRKIAQLSVTLNNPPEQMPHTPSEYDQYSANLREKLAEITEGLINNQNPNSNP